MSITITNRAFRRRIIPVNDNFTIDTSVIEVKCEDGLWYLLISTRGNPEYFTPEQADYIINGLEKDPQPHTLPVLEALQYSAYRCRMFNGGMRA